MRSAYLPRPEQEVFLDLIFDPGTSAAALAPRLEGFQAASAGSEVSALLPLLARRWGAALPGRVRLEAMEIHRYLAFRNQIRLSRLAEVLGRLSAAGVPTLVLKGAMMIQCRYGDPGLRFMEDADVMIPQERLPLALDLLSKGGWRWIMPKRLSPAMLAARHEIDMRLEDGTKMDLHWHLFGQVWHPGGDAAFWDRSRPATFHGVEACVLGPEDQLFHTCVHAAVWQPEPSLRWIADAMTILRQSPDLDWELFCREARLRRFSLALHTSLSYLGGRFAAPIPARVLESLGEAPVSEFERAEFAACTAPRNAQSGWQRGRMLWRRHQEMNPGRSRWSRWSGFPAFLQHQMHKPDFAAVLLQLVKGRFH